MKNSKEKIAVGLSGGIDSSLSAYILKKEGYDVEGVYIKCWDASSEGLDFNTKCRAEEDRAIAAEIASFLDIKFHYVDLVKEYKALVLDYFFRSYEEGLTPNPDVMCNKEIKFGLFYDWALASGFTKIATGHYAKNINNNSVYELHRAVDVSKDQSYFLYLLTEKKLHNVVFPLGETLKKENRLLAKEVGLSNWSRKDSQGICFIGDIDVRDFLKSKLKPKKGRLLFKDGTQIGEHDGAHFFTVGQRHGFKTEKYFGMPLYVISKDVKNNDIVVGFISDVLQNTFIIKDVHFINSPPSSDTKYYVRLRNLGKLHKCTVHKVNDNEYSIIMEDKEFGVAPGQSAVLYDDTRVVGGGIIY